MTKAELIRLLEPFDDEIVLCVINKGYHFPARAFYSTMKNEANIIIHSDDLAKNFKQVIELKP